jgi:hypothetical protein
MCFAVHADMARADFIEPERAALHQRPGCGIVGGGRQDCLSYAANPI